jgi:hypothetical protein
MMGDALIGIIVVHPFWDASVDSSPLTHSGLTGHLDLGLIKEGVPDLPGGGLAVLFGVFFDQPLVDCFVLVADNAWLLRGIAWLNGA